MVSKKLKEVWPCIISPYVYMRISIYKNGNYSIVMDIGPRPTVHTSIKQVTLSQRDVNVLYSMPPASCSGSINRTGLFVQPEHYSNMVILHYHGQKMLITKNEWDKCLRCLHDLVVDYTIAQKYYTKTSPWEPGIDIAMLKHLLIRCANYRRCAIREKYNERLCLLHKHCRLDDSYAITKQAIKDIDISILSEILRINKYYPVQVTMDQIIGQDYDYIVEKVHTSNTFLITHAIMLTPPTFSTVYCKNLDNKNIQEIGCILCKE